MDFLFITLSDHDALLIELLPLGVLVKKEDDQGPDVKPFSEALHLELISLPCPQF